MSGTATLTELTLIEGSSDKFYRVFVIPTPAGFAVTCQYGRNGTYGTFTPRKNHTAVEAAAAADKAVAGKMAKGYKVVRCGEFPADTEPTDGQLDTAANLMPAGTSNAGTPQVRDHSAVVAAINADGQAVDPAVLKRVLGEFALMEFPDRFGPADPAAAGTPRPMLAGTAVARDLPRLLADAAWVMQPKLDGDRVLIEVRDGIVAVYNRQGQPKVTNVPAAALAAFLNLTAGRWVFDGEIVGRTLHLFDMPAGPYHQEDAPWHVRDTALAVTMRGLGVAAAGVGVVRAAFGTDAKRAMLTAAETERREGVILRNIASPYTSGRTAALLKHKFTKTVDAVITAVGIGGKANAALGVHNPDGQMVHIGQVSTIGKGEHIAVGDVVEVRYLYTTDPDSPVLFQPTILRTRHDKAAAECLVAQLDGMHTDRNVTWPRQAATSRTERSYRPPQHMKPAEPSTGRTQWAHTVSPKSSGPPTTQTPPTPA